MRDLHNVSNSADIINLGNLMLRPTNLPFVTHIWGKHTIRRFDDNFHHQSKCIGYKFMNLNFSWTYFKIFYLWISSGISNNSIEIYIKLKKKIFKWSPSCYLFNIFVLFAIYWAPWLWTEFQFFLKSQAQMLYLMFFLESSIPLHRTLKDKSECYMPIKRPIQVFGYNQLQS